jgi:hypothetical protein
VTWWAWVLIVAAAYVLIMLSAVGRHLKGHDDYEPPVWVERMLKDGEL